VRVSRTITRQVMEQGVAILGADVPGSGVLSGWKPGHLPGAIPVVRAADGFQPSIGCII